MFSGKILVRGDKRMWGMRKMVQLECVFRKNPSPRRGVAQITEWGGGGVHHVMVKGGGYGSAQYHQFHHGIY